MTDASPFSIRRLAPDDVGALRQLLTVFGAAFEDMETYAGAPPDDAYLRGLLRGDSFVALVAMQDGAVVGGLTAYDLKKPERARSEFYIYDLAVAAEHRRRGIATRLIDALKPIAAGRGAAVIFVQADRTDPPAIALYETLGAREDVLHFDIETGESTPMK